MSILKAIMHHYNATTKNYDTLHPETEASQITDWHSSIMASLASKTLGTVVDAVTTDSVLGKLIKLLLNASGVKYLIDTNGYICFGSFFGGVILQWGVVLCNREYNFPISFTYIPRTIGEIAAYREDTSKYTETIEATSSTSFVINGFRNNEKANDITAMYVSIGK